MDLSISCKDRVDLSVSFLVLPIPCKDRVDLSIYREVFINSSFPCKDHAGLWSYVL